LAICNGYLDTKLHEVVQNISTLLPF